MVRASACRYFGVDPQRSNHVQVNDVGLSVSWCHGNERMGTMCLHGFERRCGRDEGADKPDGCGRTSANVPAVFVCSVGDGGCNFTRSNDAVQCRSGLASDGRAKLPPVFVPAFGSVEFR